MSSPQVVMVLGGGGAKTAAHLGAARALREAGITPRHWIGTSMGAVMAAALAAGASPEALLDRVTAVRRNDVLRNDWFALMRGIWADAILRPEPVRRLIEQIVPARSFEALTAPCTVTAVDVATGREVAFGSGGEPAPLIDALAAACALPPYFPAAEVNGRRYYDGGLRAPVPIDRAAGIECTAVIAIHTAPGFDEHGERVEVPPPLITAADTAIGWLMAGTVELQRERWNLVPGRPPLIWLRPVTDRGAMFAAERTAAYAEAGYREMTRVLEEMS